MGLVEQVFNQSSIIVYIKLIIVFIIGLLIYSLMKQFIYWITFNEKFRISYKIMTIIILVISLRFI